MMGIIDDFKFTKYFLILRECSSDEVLMIALQEENLLVRVICCMVYVLAAWELEGIPQPSKAI